tara:strand:+ start:49 stop:546 length:498 start_codon:yes stop_codon:yes gene_type:complete
MGFKMKRKGFPMKSSPNKIREYSSAMKQGVVNVNKYGPPAPPTPPPPPKPVSLPADIELRAIGDIDDKELQAQEDIRRDEELRKILADNPDMFEKVTKKYGDVEVDVWTNKETGETAEEYRKRMFREGQRKTAADSGAADSGDTGDTGEYKDLASIKRTNLNQGL